MNLKGKYDMLRQAALLIVGVPDDMDMLKKMASELQIPAMHDPDALVSLVLVQTLGVTHDGAGPAEAYDVRAQAVTDLISNARKVWMDENPCEDGHDHVTPFDHLLYGVVHEQRH